MFQIDNELMKHFLKISCLLALFLATPLKAQMITEKPKLVVGIIVDQMKQDYLTRFYHKFGEDGFKRLAEQGFMARNGHFNYAPTVTGPGHASVYTGTTPANHGIAGNTWYSRVLKRSVYCAEDTAVANVGGSPSASTKLFLLVVPIPTLPKTNKSESPPSAPVSPITTLLAAPT